MSIKKLLPNFAEVFLLIAFKRRLYSDYPRLTWGEKEIVNEIIYELIFFYFFN